MACSNAYDADACGCHVTVVCSARKSPNLMLSVGECVSPCTQAGACAQRRTSMVSFLRSFSLAKPRTTQSTCKDQVQCLLVLLAAAAPSTMQPMNGRHVSRSMNSACLPVALRIKDTDDRRDEARGDKARRMQHTARTSTGIAAKSSRWGSGTADRARWHHSSSSDVAGDTSANAVSCCSSVLGIVDAFSPRCRRQQPLLRRFP